MLYGLDLFSGYGGISLSLEEYVKPVAYCEIEKYAQGILLSRMSEGLLRPAPIWDDIRTLPVDELGEIDIVYGGTPCQNFSLAGDGKGLEGERSGLFFEMCKVVKKIKPKFVFLENVPAVRTRGLSEIIKSFADIRYDCRWTCLSAKEIGASHIRKRWFLLAYSNSKQVWDKQQRQPWRQENGVCDQRKNEPLLDGAQRGLAGPLQRKREVESSLARVVNDDPFWVDRIKSIGNGVVPLQAKTAFERLMGIS